MPAIALNTSRPRRGRGPGSIADAERETGLLPDDVVRFGAERVLEAVLGALDKKPA